MARLRHCLLKPHASLSWSRHEQGHRDGVAFRHGTDSSSLNPTRWGKCYAGLRSVSKGNVGLRGTSGGGGGGLKEHSCPPLWMSMIIRIITNRSHAQTQSPFLLLHYIYDTAQACHTACTSEASASRLWRPDYNTTHITESHACS